MPEPLTRVEGIAAALPNHNIDTDVIMPKRFLRTITREGLADGVLADLRFAESGDRNPAFVLNKDPWTRAVILVTGDNFGCGSSREHAVWGLHQLGIRALVGTSFAGIFYDNCRRNGLAAITVERGLRDRLLALAAEAGTARMTIDIERQMLRHHGGSASFALPPDVRADLLAGRDAIATTLERADEIRAFERRYWAGRRTGG